MAIIGLEPRQNPNFYNSGSRQIDTSNRVGVFLDPKTERVLLTILVEVFDGPLNTAPEHGAATGSRVKDADHEITLFALSEQHNPFMKRNKNNGLAIPKFLPPPGEGIFWDWTTEEYRPTAGDWQRDPQSGQLVINPEWDAEYSEFEYSYFKRVMEENPSGPLKVNAIVEAKQIGRLS